MTSGKNESPGPLPIDVQIQVDQQPGESVSITIESLSADGVPIETEVTPSPWVKKSRPSLLTVLIPERLKPAPKPVKIPQPTVSVAILPKVDLAARSRSISLEMTLFGLSLLTYLSTRLIGLVNFPIYFFTDEAIQTVLASDFVRDHFHNYDGDFFPTFFVNGGQYNLGTSVYLQIIPYLLIGKSVWVTRGIAVLATLMAAISVSLALRSIFKVRYWWAGTLVLSVIPAWFLHSRTAFETGLMVSLYAVFLFFYLLYRNRSPRYLYAALVFGALVIYTYSPGQMVMLVTGALLLISDIRYHLKNWKSSIIGFGLLILVALPYARFIVTRGSENYRHLVLLGSYLIDNIPLVEKVRLFGLEYLKGLNPIYWFLPNNNDLARHLMKGYGHMAWFTFPLLVVGLINCLKNFRSSAHRVVLIALLAAPSGAALVQLGITRALVMVIPAAILITLGMCSVLDWLAKRYWQNKTALAVILFGVLAGYNVFMLRDALVNGPTWFKDYGLGGMQYGADQIFGEIKNYLTRAPDTKIILTPSWSNGTDVVARFFLPDTTTVILGSIDGFIFDHKPLSVNTIFILIPDEYQRMLDTKKFTDVKIEKTLPYPDGSPGFYFVHLRYVDNIDAILEAEKEARRVLISEDETIDGQPVTVRYSMLDMGPIKNLFDGEPNSLVRSLEANPMVIELVFNQPCTLRGVTLKVGGTATEVKAVLHFTGSDQTLVYDKDFANTPQEKDVSLDFGGPRQISLLHLEVKSIYDSEPAHVHIWELRLNE